MNYSDTLEYLFSRLPMFSKTGAAAIKADLTNTRTICASLGDPQHKFKSIHIAGTNGKGSCSHMLAAIMQSCGYKTGLYTSPHLKDFRERIKINGEMISQQFVIDFTKNIKPLIEEINPSFFEITVGMAFDYFAKEKVDIAIIETGLGGRLDSTNIITPIISVITNIGMDHMNILGNTPQQIAAEKAGIIKKSIPVVIGETSEETEEVFISVAEENNAPITFADQLRYTANWSHEDGYLVTDLIDKQNDTRVRVELDLPGYYQLKNLLTVAETVCHLPEKGFPLDPAKMLYAFKHVKKLTGLHGRWEVIHHNPSVILDVAHNEDGIRELMKQVELSDYHELHIVTGMVRDKEIDKILSLLPDTAHYYFTQAHIPRALPAEQLQQRAEAAGLVGHAYPDVNLALKNALSKAGKNDIILVCGSVFTVGEVLPIHT
ncbi:MAG: bifunctional folylpolyglutamate synthase/dihydrofolate synthase [Chitinophagaceae bacterium]|nr:bifunctional folylpolyglutamate synthase/dihydrofolate synthase [Chitinophagaceae bacterium]